jgi:hypothetical protein
MFNTLNGFKFPITIDQMDYPYQRATINSLFELVGFLGVKTCQTFRLIDGTIDDGNICLEGRMRGSEIQSRFSIRARAVCRYSGLDQLHVTVLESLNMHKSFIERAALTYVQLHS